MHFFLERETIKLKESTRRTRERKEPSPPATTKKHIDIDMGSFGSITGNCLLFCLVFGMSATVDVRQMERQLRNRKAILTAVGMQFVVLPMIGFLVVQCAKVDFAIGVTLLVITTSPGGSYSNW